MSTVPAPDALSPRDAFTRCPRCASPGNAAPPEATYFDCGACGFRYHFNAAVSASALITRPDGALFLIRRARDPAKGKLAYPGGFVDPYETAEEAVTRETAEEVGLTVTGIRYLASFVNPYTYRGIVYPVLDLFFVVTVDDDRVTLARDEATDALWRDPRSLDPEEIAFPSMRKALTILLQQNGFLAVTL